MSVAAEMPADKSGKSRLGALEIRQRLGLSELKLKVVKARTPFRELTLDEALALPFWAPQRALTVEERSVAVEICKEIQQFADCPCAVRIEPGKPVPCEMYQLPSGAIVLRLLGVNVPGEGPEGGGMNTGGGIALHVKREMADYGLNDVSGLLLPGTTDAQGFVEEIGETDEAGHAPA
ncbi:MAG: hypothetical protein WCP45_16460 [Verrucomicrobiota bacterium]